MAFRGNVEIVIYRLQPYFTQKRGIVCVLGVPSYVLVACLFVRSFLIEERWKFHLTVKYCEVNGNYGL